MPKRRKVAISFVTYSLCLQHLAAPVVDRSSVAAGYNPPKKLSDQTNYVPANRPVQNLAPGTVIDGKYKILSAVGSGGFGTVYRVQQIQLDRIVALKALNGHYADSEAMARFEREAMAISAMHHKNLVTFYGYGIWEHTAYMIMEYLEGQSLDRLLRQNGKMSVPESVSTVRQICEALKCAHAHGIVHRDLKPTNVMLAERNEGDNIKVIDFGLAKMTSGFGVELQKLTAEGFAVGSVSYMSPEQCITGAVDHRSDLYAAGCILHACLTGLPPFSEGDSMVIMRAHVQVEPEPIAARCPDLVFPERLQDILDRALAKEPAERYQSAEEMLHDLSDLASSKRVKLIPKEAASARTKQPAKFNLSSAVIWASTFTLVLLVLCFGFYKLFWSGPDESVITSRGAAKKAEALDREVYEDGEDTKPVAVLYEQAARLARVDYLLNDAAVMRIQIRLAELAKMRGSPSDQEMFAQSVLDMADRSGGGGEQRTQATALLINAFCDTHNFPKALQLSNIAWLQERPVELSEDTAQLYAEYIEAFFCSGEFNKFSVFLDRIKSMPASNKPPERLAQRIVVLEGEREILRKNYKAADALFAKALAMPDSHGVLISRDPMAGRMAMAGRIFWDQARTAILMGEWGKAKSVLETEHKYMKGADYSRSCLHSLMQAHAGHWETAEQEVLQKLEYLRHAPQSIFADWAFIEVPEFIRIAKAAGKKDVAARLQAVYDSLPVHSEPWKE